MTMYGNVNDTSEAYKDMNVLLYIFVSVYDILTFVIFPFVNTIISCNVDL